jgi:hypothetical protein
MESGQNKRLKPNFLIVGAAKAGTTSLAKYLGVHPNIFIPEQKELRFFIKDTVSRTNPKDLLLEGILKSSVLDENEYFNTFDVKEKLAGEASVHYLYHYKEAIPNIKKHVGDIPIIIMLRNPVKRAVSNCEYLYNGHKNTFEKELGLEKERTDNNYNSFWYYKKLGLYADQVDAYLNNFSNVKIILFEEFIADTENEMKDVYSFLGVKPISNEYQVFNKSTKDTTFRKILWRLRIIQMLNAVISRGFKAKLKKQFKNILYSEKKEIVNEKILADLYSYFEEDVLRLELLLEKDLQIWKN